VKVALVHYWLVGMRGGEKVLEALCELYPEADIYTHVLDRSSLSPTLLKHRISTTFIDRLPQATRWYQKYLPLMPMALEQLDLTDYDLVISSESGPAKGIITSPTATHICYCHSPMRYVWDMYHEYLASAGAISRFLMRPLIHYLKIWDYASAARVDHFVANSNYVAARINKFYRRDAEVVHPPVATGEFSPDDEREDYYLMVGQLVAYKRPDLAVEAFSRMGKRLLVIGDGEQAGALRAMASANIEFLGWQSIEEIKRRYARCQALIFPGVEDFGIVPLEATASGRPVIAFARGGALETVRDEVTGLFFREQTVAGLIEAVEAFERDPERFEVEAMVDWAERFSGDRFKREMQSIIERALA
jgi:glycosyltransferase involved in cell wall biosynthesis